VAWLWLGSGAVAWRWLGSGVRAWQWLGSGLAVAQGLGMTWRKGFWKNADAKDAQAQLLPQFSESQVRSCAC